MSFDPILYAMMKNNGGGSGGGGGSGLQTVTFTTAIPDFDTTSNVSLELTAEESAALDAALSSAQPIIVAIPVGTDGAMLYWTFGLMMGTDGSYIYVGVLMNGIQALFTRTGNGVWMMVYSPAQ